MTSVDDRARDGRTAHVLAGGGEMGAQMRALDWSATPLGPVERWPSHLRTAVRICLDSRFPMVIWWGQELSLLYNDGWIPILGAKHPQALGSPGRQVWAEVWDVIGPMFARVLATGEATWTEDGLLLAYRHGYTEEAYFTWSYSPIRAEDGAVDGVFTAVTETTARVLGERRMRTLRDLAARSLEARQVDEACRISVETLGTNARDLPFALLYLVDGAGDRARLVGAAGIALGTAASPLAINLEDEGVWPLGRAARTGQADLVEGLQQRFGALPGGAWPVSPHAALILPATLPGHERSSLLLVAAISPRRALDAAYRDFLALAVGHIATAVTTARAYEEERRRAEALAELDRAKTAFFNNVSHEFRTPLTLMLGPLEDVLAAPADTALVREQVAAAHRNTLRLLRLVNTLLDFSRVEGARMEAVYEPTDLAALTAELAGVFRSAIERAGLRLLVDCPPLPEPVYADHDMWEKIVLNLLSNALKFTLEGEIAVTLRAADGSAVLTVRDTGTGIPDAELPHLFERFHRIRGARARTHEGTGIGLALAHDLVRLHGGSIGVESMPGAGTTFTVTLPLGTAHLPPERIQAARTQVSTALGAAPYVEEALRWLPDPAEPPERQVIADVSAADTARLGAAMDGAAPRARVLLADDNADLRDYLTRLLAARYEVRAVANGAQALDAARAEPPDLVLSDVMMPELDGFGLLRELRADPRTGAIPVVLLSARAGEEASVEGLQAGADDYLVKPFSARELLARVRTHIELARLRARAMEAERALREEAEAGHRRLGEIFQQAPAMVAVLRGPAHVFEVANRLYQQGAGRSSADLLGRSIRAAFPELAGQGFYELLDEVYRSGTPYVGTEIPVQLDRRGDGILEDVYFTFTYQPLRDTAGAIDGIVVVAVDVTTQMEARRRAEELAGQVRAERDRLQQVVDLLPAAVVVTDTALTIQVSNRAVRDLLGADGAAQRPPVDAGDAVPADDADAFAAYGARHLDGTPYSAAELPLVRAALRGEEVRGEQMLLRNAANGRDVPILVNAASLRDASGDVTGGVVVFQDIAALRALERAREEFLSSAAHDLKTPLTSIRAQAQLAQRRLTRMNPPSAETAPLLDQLARIQRGTDVMLGLINELLDVTQLEMGGGLDLQCQPTDLVALVRDCVAAQQGVGTAAIALEARVPELVADVDADRVARVVGNLLSNAIKYSPDGGTVTVRVARADGAAGPEALIAVSDQGMGIPAADLPHIFDRFVRAGNVVGHIQGTGIGLASARGIVEQHGGSIGAESVEGSGSAFTIRLPLAYA